MVEPILSITNLEASINEKPILNGVSFSVRVGEIHILMGPNGSGKSTLAHAIMGSPLIKVTSGKIEWKGDDITHEPPEMRAKWGLFLGFQQPPEVAGVGMELFVRSVRASNQEPVQSSDELKKNLEGAFERVGLGSRMLERNINEGFSGGEKKRSELFQLSVFAPKLAIMDEIDSGLDVDGAQMAARELEQFISGGGSLLVITHTGTMARSLNPDVVYIMKEGKIITTGDKDVIRFVEENGFESL